MPKFLKKQQVPGAELWWRRDGAEASYPRTYSANIMMEKRLTKKRRQSLLLSAKEHRTNIGWTNEGKQGKARNQKGMSTAPNSPITNHDEQKEMKYYGTTG